MNFIKKILERVTDDSVHLLFQKFSKGEFRDRAFIKAKRSGEKYTIYTTAEFAREMVKDVAEKIGNDMVPVKGVIITTSDLTGELEFKEKKQFQGVKKYFIEKDMSGEEILKLLEKFKKAFFALSFSSKDTNLKIKPKAPKTKKPSSKGKADPKPDFCKLVTTDANLGKSFVFEKPDFKEAYIDHTFVITELIFPEGEKDYSKIREIAKKKGKILRHAIIDGKEMNQEIEFEV